MALLQRALSYTSSIVLAAASCQVNFRWMHFNAKHWLPLLDFDVICGALPTFALHGQIERRLDSSLDVLNFHPVGPYTLRSLLSELDDYTLPPGTVGELLHHQDMLTGKLSNRAKGFLNTLENVKLAENPSVLFAASQRTLGDLLLQDLSLFTEEVRDVRLLEHILKNQTAIETFYTDANTDQQSVDAYRAVYHYLQGARPALSLNNFHDAVNVASVVRLYNAQAQDLGPRLVPILISDTDLLRGFEGLTNWLRPTTAETPPPVLLHDHLYLLISQGLFHLCEGRHRTAADEAELLEREARNLERTYSELLLTCRNRVDAGMPERELSIDMLSEHEMSMLFFARTSFDEEWRTLLAPSIGHKEQDRTELLNALMSPGVKSLLTDRNPGAVRNGVSLLEKNLQAYRHPEYDIWELLLEYGKTGPQALGSIRSQLFSFSITPADGRLLRDVVAGVPLADFDATCLKGQHDIRLAVLPNYIGIGAVLAVDSWSDADHKRFLSITWAHKCAAIDIADALTGFLYKVLPLRLVAECSVFTTQQKYIDRVYLKDLAATARRLCERDGYADFLQMSTAAISACADLHPLDGVEKQAIISFQANQWTEAVGRLSGQMIAQTIEMPIDFQYVSELLDEAMRVLCSPYDEGVADAKI